MGIIKILADLEGRLLAAHMAGPGVGELVGELTLAIQAGLTYRELAEALHPHPTVSEGIMEAAESLGIGAVHLP